MLAVPDAAYQNWVVRLDLHRIAMYGFPTPETIPSETTPVTEQDNVLVTPKKQKSTGTDE